MSSGVTCYKSAVKFTDATARQTQLRRSHLAKAPRHHPPARSASAPEGGIFRETFRDPRRIRGPGRLDIDLFLLEAVSTRTGIG